ncbi:tripartite tricarboxylate transporter permease [Candidatus Woesearchaeota archaeon]|nr:tripartite tricarboxylate transporter permease [Candidatus Woesearchaeota archaeon]
MFIELVAAIIVGCALGTITGLTPGLHINLVSAMILGLMPLIGRHFQAELIAAAIIAMSLAHIFVDFVPSVFLSAADEGTALAALPGNELLLQGLGFEAVRLAVTGCFLGLVLMALAAPLLVIAVPVIFSSISGLVGHILLLFAILSILLQKSWKERLWCFLVFLLSGLLGIVVFSIEGFSEPLLPMLSGLFGISLLMANLGRSAVIPRQHIVEVFDLRFRDFFRPVASAAFSGSLVCMFPALGPAQSASIASRVFRQGERWSYLVLIGGVSSVSMMMGIVTLYSIGKARNGSIAAAGNIIGSMQPQGFSLFILVALVSGCIAVFLALACARCFASLIARVNYRMLCAAIIAFVFLMTAAFSGIAGLIVLVTASAIGMIPILAGVSRSNAMGCLILPVIVYYLA